MTAPLPLLPLPGDWEPTRATLHVYANALGVIARAHAVPNEKWWHISLKVKPTGLVTDTMPLPDGGTFNLRMDFRSHETILETSSGEMRTLSMATGMTGSEFGQELIAIVGEFGLAADYVAEKFTDNDPRAYDPAAAEQFFAAMVNIDHNLELHRSSLAGPVGPLQVWPHGFDLAFEWFGTRTESYEEDGVAKEAPAQLNLGFYPAGRAYFYSNPWPFHGDKLVGTDLPHGAAWVTDSFEGSSLPYASVAGDSDGIRKLREYARAVWEVASPTLS